MQTVASARLALLAESEPVSFGPLSEYRKLIGEEGLPLFTGVQTCRPGYQTSVHWHPYVEYLFVIEGQMEAWLVGAEEQVQRLGAGDILALPANTPHVFRNAGDSDLRLLGIHTSPTRIVHRLDET
jgi:quercetin dioxygenase-like cupin family protein